MSIKDTLTNNSMDSFSFGGKTYTRRVDNGAVVYDISAGTDGSAFSTGWVNEDPSGTAVANGATLTFNHNLGTKDLVVDIYVSSNADGSNPQDFQRGHASNTSLAYGGGVTNITENTLEIQLASQGYLDLDSSGQVTTTSFSGKYIKVVVSAKIGSGAGGTPAGADRQLQFNDNGTFGANANLRFDGSTAYIPRLAVGEGNVDGDEGGEIFMYHAPNGTLAGDGVAIDVFQNQIRFYEYGPPYKGAYIDLTECAEHSAGMTNLLASGGGGGTSSGGGGYIDKLSVATNNAPATFPDFDENTQVILAQVRESGSSASVLEELPVGTNSLTMGVSYGGNSGNTVLSLTSGGVVTAYDTASGNTVYTVHLYRFAKGSASSGGGGGASVTTDTTAPTNPSDGDLWYDESSAALYVYTDSIAGWIQANGGGGGGAGLRAYVSFDGKDPNVNSTMANVFNVSSITDNATGNYTVTFANPISNPVVSATIASDQTYAQNPYPKESKIAVFEISSTSVQVRTGRGSYSAIDCPVHLVVF